MTKPGVVLGFWIGPAGCTWVNVAPDAAIASLPRLATFAEPYAAGVRRYARAVGDLRAQARRRVVDAVLRAARV